MNVQVNPESVNNYSLSLDNIVHIFWKIVWTFESTHEHSSEPRKCGQLFFKFRQYCPHFLENSMNIRVYTWTFKWTRKCGQLFFKFGQYCPHFLENNMNIRVYTWTFKWTQKVFSRNLVSKLRFEWALEMFWILKHKFASWKPESR